MIENRRRAKLLAAVGLAAALIPAAGAQASPWQWSIAPYMWLSEIAVDASIDDRQVLEREADLDEVLDDLDFSLQLRTEGRRDRHGLFLDFYYSDLGDDDKRFALPGGREIVAKGDFEMSVIEAGGLFNPRGDGTGFALLYGARVLDLDEEIDARFDFGPGSTASRRYEASKTLVDGLVGARYFGRISDRWSFLVETDVSAGGTELTWNAGAGLAYSFGAGGRYALVAGYRYLEIEFEEEDRRADIESQVKLGGFLAGLKFGL